MVRNRLRSAPSCVLGSALRGAVLPFPPPCTNRPRRTLALLGSLLDVGTDGTGIQAVLQGKVGRKGGLCGVSHFLFKKESV